MTVPTPPPERQCRAVTRKGTRCSGWALDGTDKCISHVEDPDRMSPVRRDPAAAKRRQSEKAKERKAEQELRSLGLREQLRLRAEDRRAELVTRLLDCATHPDPKIALPALSLIFDRSIGKVPQAQLTLAGTLSTADQEALRSAVSALPPADRLALAREKLGLPPAHPDIEVKL